MNHVIHTIMFNLEKAPGCIFQSKLYPGNALDFRCSPYDLHFQVATNVPVCRLSWAALWVSEHLKSWTRSFKWGQHVRWDSSHVSPATRDFRSENFEECDSDLLKNTSSILKKKSLLMSVVGVPQLATNPADTHRDKWLWTAKWWHLRPFSRVKLMVGMGVVQDPGVLGDLGTVVNLQESTRNIPLRACSPCVLDLLTC